MGFVHETIVQRPNKTYGCYLCGKEITGEHIKVFFVDGVKGCSYRTHKDCYKEAQKMCADCDYCYDCQYDVAECFYERMKDRSKR